jgi:serine/threonine-protein kinase
MVSAEGLADTYAEHYSSNRDLLRHDVIVDAKRQAVGKALATLVDGAYLGSKYLWFTETILDQPDHYIARVVKQSAIWQGEDGFTHALLTAAVDTEKLRASLNTLLDAENAPDVIKRKGNPRIAIRVDVASGGQAPSHSAIAENILKGRIKAFGYRVWSEAQADSIAKQDVAEAVLQGQVMAANSYARQGGADFKIEGVAQLQKVTVNYGASGIKLGKYVLNSWTIRCIDLHTGEEIYFNNQLPVKRSWNSQDAALAEIGKAIGSKFSKDFFKQRITSDSNTYQLSIMGIPDYDVGVLIKKELIGLNSILQVDFRSFDALGASLYEIESSLATENLAGMLDEQVFKPLNRKMGSDVFRLSSVRRGMIKVIFDTLVDTQALKQRLTSLPPASLVNASPERLRQLAFSDEALGRIEQINPEGVAAMRSGQWPPPSGALEALRDF